MRRASVLPLLVLLASVVLAGCDGVEERPLTLAERVAGTWELTRVRDGFATVTPPFVQSVGTVELALESVGCCAGSAAYRLTVTRPNGEVVETRQTYLANDNPDDGDDFILLQSNDGPLALTLAYDFNSSFTEMTLTALGDGARVNENLALLGIGFQFRQQAVFEFDKVGRDRGAGRFAFVRHIGYFRR